MSLRQLIYSSFANADFDSDEVDEIVSKAGKQNASLSISGLLLFDGSQFVQLLEGPAKVVETLYRKIQKDRRHHSVVTLVDREVEHRLFSSWNMGYQSLDAPRDTSSHPQRAALNMMSKLADGLPELEGSQDQPSILIVDDEIINLRLLDAILGKGSDVHAATNGHEALEVVDAHDIDLILLDVDMPGLSGFEVCAQLKLNASTREIPVIFVSALTESGHKVTGLGVGGCDYISKPFNAEEIQARVSLHLEMAQLRAELKCSLNDLQEKNKRLDMFARSLAHDLRNPLSSIIAYSSLHEVDPDSVGLDNGPMDEIRLAGDNMLDTIDSLLLLATSQKESVQLASVDMGHVGRTCCNDLQRMIEEYNGTITIDSDLPGCLAHSSWVRRILTNLFSNALKYAGEDPKVRFYSENSDQDNIVRYIVHDNGRGLNNDQIASLFNEYTRLAPEQAPGIGLGLVLVKSLTTQMNGTITVESSPEEGTKFIIDLPDTSDVTQLVKENSNLALPS